MIAGKRFFRRNHTEKTNKAGKDEDRIIRDPATCGGEPIFKGTRVTLRTVLASLAAGDAPEDIIGDFPSLKADDVKAAIAFAAASAKEDLPVSAIPQIQ